MNLTQYQKVREFMQAFGQECPMTQVMPSDAIRELRYDLIMEESDELYAAKTRVDEFDAILDIRYVVIGTVIAYGFQMEAIDPTLYEVSWGLDEINYELLADENIHEVSIDLCRLVRRVQKEEERLGFTQKQLTEGFNEVHRSNMSKFWSREELRRACLIGSPNVALSGFNKFIVRDGSGKILKSPSYSPANLEPILEGNA